MFAPCINSIKNTFISICIYIYIYIYIYSRHTQQIIVVYDVNIYVLIISHNGMASVKLKTLFIVPTDAHYYKIIEMLKQFKIIILPPTCFSSCRNHHQGAVLCLAKTTKWFFCARRYRRSQHYGSI